MIHPWVLGASHRRHIGLPDRHDLSWFAREVSLRASTIGAPASYLPTFGHSEDFARPHIEYDGVQFHFVVVERGREIERVSSPDPDVILYKVFEAVTFSMAGDYEVRHRRINEDTRRQLFETQLKLLGRLSDAWQRRAAAAQVAVLRDHPFSDDGAVPRS
jgi:hypothetical protein